MTRTALRLTALTLLAWLACFVVLKRLGTWTPFAFVGVPLATASLLSQAVPSALLRPSFRTLGLGLAAGALMVVFTHVAYDGIATLLPGVREATRELLTLLNVVGFSPSARAALIVVIAGCEEVLFRGLLPSFAARGPTRPHWPTTREFTLLLALTSAYALSTAPLGSPLLVLCALTCGVVWGMMRVTTGSLLVPILAHVVWDVGVLVLWPLSV